MARLNSRSLEYSPWYGMVRRCTVPTDPGYARYGGSGINVFEEWTGPDGFLAFVGHIGPRPTSLHQIDRINNAFGYFPGNVRWATTKEQARNRTNNVVIEFNSRRMVASDWAEHLGISRQSLQKRLRYWPLDRALSQTAARRKVSALSVKVRGLTPATLSILRYAKNGAFTPLEYATRNGDSASEVQHGPLGSIVQLSRRLAKSGLLSDIGGSLALTDAGRAALEADDHG